MGSFCLIRLPLPSCLEHSCDDWISSSHLKPWFDPKGISYTLHEQKNPRFLSLWRPHGGVMAAPFGLNDCSWNSSIRGCTQFLRNVGVYRQRLWQVLFPRLSIFITMFSLETTLGSSLVEVKEHLLCSQRWVWVAVPLLPTCKPFDKSVSLIVTHSVKWV